MTEDHATAVRLIRALRRTNPTGTLVLALDDEVERLNDELNGTIELGNQAREALSALRQRHAEAVERAYREAFWRSAVTQSDDDDQVAVDAAWEKSEAKAALEADHE